MGRERFLRQLGTRVADRRVIAAAAAVPRELFMVPALSRFAYADRALPIGGGQTISQPSLVARMCELLQLREDDVVLDVGTGSGYHAAVLAQLCRHVHGVELDADLAAQARRSLGRAGIHNVTVVQGDGAGGLPAHAPYDAINVAAAAGGDVPAALVEQLAAGGRLIAPVAFDDVEHLVLLHRTSGGVERSVLDAVRFVPLR